MTHQGSSFGEYLYRVRQERGWSLREAAQRAGIAFSRLGEIERGIDPHSGKAFVPTYLVVCRLAKAYDLPPDELLRMAGHDPGPELTPDEWKLLGAYRRLPEAARRAFLDALERQNGEVARLTGPEALAEQAAYVNPDDH